MHIKYFLKSSNLGNELRKGLKTIDMLGYILTVIYFRQVTMEFKIHPHRHGEKLLESECKEQWEELKDVLLNITDDNLINQFPHSSNKMSLSSAINDLIRVRLVEKGWTKEAQIFQDSDYSDSREKVWRLDFAKDDLSVEVSFNHGEALAWNLTKPVLASELNHVQKAIQTKIGIIILATDDFKKDGAFDGSVGSYEKAIRYLKPMNDLLSVPLVLIGLKSPKSFKVEKVKEGNSHKGVIKRL